MKFLKLTRGFGKKQPTLKEHNDSLNSNFGIITKAVAEEIIELKAIYTELTGEEPTSEQSSSRAAMLRAISGNIPDAPGPLPVLETLPANDATKAGERFWYNGTEWTYAYTGQFGTLEAGTVWPVKGYREYVALLTQTGTNAPTAAILLNTLGTVTWTRDDIGIYEGTTAELYPANKTAIIIGQDDIYNSDSGMATRKSIELTSSIVRFSTISENTDAIIDGALANTKISIQVYP